MDTASGRLHAHSYSPRNCGDGNRRARSYRRVGRGGHQPRQSGECVLQTEFGGSDALGLRCESAKAGAEARIFRNGPRGRVQLESCPPPERCGIGAGFTLEWSRAGSTRCSDHQPGPFRNQHRGTHAGDGPLHTGRGHVRHSQLFARRISDHDRSATGVLSCREFHQHQAGQSRRESALLADVGHSHVGLGS